MSRYLLLSIRFLDDRYHGLTDNGEKPEWPPSPFRLFQALIAGNSRGEEIPHPTAAALRWLESLAPPDIIAPDARAGRALLTYVLNNVSDENMNSRAPKSIRPTLLNGDRLVRYAWSFDPSQTDGDVHADEMIRAVRHIRALGWGIDLAIGHGETVDTMPEPTTSRVQYHPSPVTTLGGLDLRAPRKGSFASLQGNYADYLRRYETPGITRLESASGIYQPQRYAVGASRPCVVFRLLNDDGDEVSVRQQLIAPLIGMIRDLANRPNVIREVGQDSIDRLIKGHPRESTPERVSILALPTIRDGPTDGRIRRVLLMQPGNSAGGLIRILSELFDGQRLKPLEGEQRFPKPIRLELMTRRDSVVSLYTGISNVWASVTPVLLPGYDDRKQHRGDQSKRLDRARQLIQKAMEQSQLPQPCDVELSRIPFMTGSLHASEYTPREKLAHYPRYHVQLTFSHPLTGPLSIGAGRHAGFGVMAAINGRS